MGELTLTCLTVPSNLPVMWFASENFDSLDDRVLAEDSRAIIQSTNHGSMLRLRNTTVEDGGGYICSFDHDIYGTSAAYTEVTIIPGIYFTVLYVATYICVCLSISLKTHVYVCLCI